MYRVCWDVCKLLSFESAIQIISDSDSGVIYTGGSRVNRVTTSRLS